MMSRTVIVKVFRKQNSKEIDMTHIYVRNYKSIIKAIILTVLAISYNKNYLEIKLRTKHLTRKHTLTTLKDTKGQSEPLFYHEQG